MGDKECVPLGEVELVELQAELRHRRPEVLVAKLRMLSDELQHEVARWRSDEGDNSDDGSADRLGAARAIRVLVVKLRRRARSLYADVERDTFGAPPLVSKKEPST